MIKNRFFKIPFQIVIAYNGSLRRTLYNIVPRISAICLFGYFHKVSYFRTNITFKYFIQLLHHIFIAKLSTGLFIFLITQLSILLR